MANAQSRGWGPACKPRLRTGTVRGWNFAATEEAPVKFVVDERIATLIAYLLESVFRGGYRVRHNASWSYVCRKIRGGSSMSNHAWALAIDINSDKNGMLRRKASEQVGDFHARLTDMPPWLPALFEAWGFTWGGRWKRTSDAMHLEWRRTPAEADRLSALAAEFMLSGRFGLGPDGTAITPDAGGSQPDDPNQESTMFIVFRPDGLAVLVTGSGIRVLADGDQVQALKDVGVPVHAVDDDNFARIEAVWK